MRVDGATGPCGPYSGKWGFGEVTTLKPGWQTLVFEESIGHAGSPFRLAILDEHEQVQVVLLDHIPHNDFASPDSKVRGCCRRRLGCACSMRVSLLLADHSLPMLLTIVAQDESSYVEYRITVNIPDLDCPRCSLQLLYVMTDKSTLCGIDTCFYNATESACSGHTTVEEGTCPGAPTTIPCTAKDLCFSNYHSCTDVIITGKTPLSEASSFGQPEDWPYAKLAESYYRAEVGSWVDGWLAEDVPAIYTTYVPGVC